ncbi:hypothetical protein P154DRAFT_574832 [Amniculicola lignicola CBS 123094]|uniref:ATPase AAA-type core domain-containing protein n=1 Tax=Amniculicola lignicola CBS 123094 TaxID=1392246 RepID=A0A6A5WQX3_9PLEO|nr:hypothetical protein P154DRAFT_574832 [Amniculicola lignicola CBS 123094]
MTSAEIFKEVNDVIGGRLRRALPVNRDIPAVVVPTDGGDANDGTPSTVPVLPSSSDTPLNPTQTQKITTPDDGCDLDEFGEHGETKTKKPQTWIPAVKKVFQFKDLRNNERVVPIEDFRRRNPQPLVNKGDSAKGLFKEYSMVLRKILGADLRLRDYRLEIQSLGMREIFKKIGKPYKELDLDAPSIVIRYPFRCLFFLRREFKELDTTQMPPQTKEDIEHLLNFIDTEPILKETVREYEETVERGKYRENRAWTLFPPHEMVYYKGAFAENSRHVREGCGLVERVEMLEEPLNSFVVTILVGLHDGSHFGLARLRRALSPTPSTGDIQDIKIENLPVIPMRFLPEAERDAIKKRMIERGKTYIDYCKANFTMLDYRGPVAIEQEETKKLLGKFDDSSDGLNWSWETNQRVMVDKTVEHELCPFKDGREGNFVSPSVSHFRKQPEKKKVEADDHDDEARAMRRIGVTGTSLGSNSVKSDDEIGAQEGSLGQLSDEDYMICNGEIIAFLLRNKVWALILISGMHKINWREDPYKHLQMAQEKKSLVRSLVVGFTAEGSKDLGSGEDGIDEEFDDFIAGKGKGLIFLLHGEPGLGKTLTAESVAESTRKPLYHVSTGELDTEVKKLEDSLANIFRLGLRWGAVVLLDEADVLMTKRSSLEL